MMAGWLISWLEFYKSFTSEIARAFSKLMDGEKDEENRALPSHFHALPLSDTIDTKVGILSN